MQKTSRRRCHVSYERIYNNIFCISLITHLNLPFVPLSPWITQQNPTKSHVKSNQIPVNPTMKSHHISSEIPWNLGAPAPFPYAPWCWNIYLHLPQKLPRYSIHGACGFGRKPEHSAPRWRWQQWRRWLHGRPPGTLVTGDGSELSLVNWLVHGDLDVGQNGRPMWDHRCECLV